MMGRFRWMISFFGPPLLLTSSCGRASAVSDQRRRRPAIRGRWCSSPWRHWPRPRRRLPVWRRCSPVTVIFQSVSAVAVCVVLVSDFVLLIRLMATLEPGRWSVISLTSSGFSSSECRNWWWCTSSDTYRLRGIRVMLLVMLLRRVIGAWWGHSSFCNRSNLRRRTVSTSVGSPRAWG